MVKAVKKSKANGGEVSSVACQPSSSVTSSRNPDKTPGVFCEECFQVAQIKRPQLRTDFPSLHPAPTGPAYPAALLRLQISIVCFSPSQKPEEKALHLSSAPSSSCFPGAVTKVSEQGCLYSSSTPALPPIPTLEAGIQPTQTKNSADMQRTLCLHNLPQDQLQEGTRKKQTCIRDSDGPSCLITKT